MTLKSHFAPAIFTAFAFTLAAVPAANALDAYWHGVRSTDWNDGKAGEDSNWYEMAPPNGNPLNVPDGTAFFAPGAQNLIVTVDTATTIRKVDFTAGNDQYVIVVNAPGSLAIRGAGVANASALVQKFTVDGAAARLQFRNAAVAGIAGSANRIRITNDDGGQTKFRDTSEAANADIVNQQNGKVWFLNDSSAGTADILNKFRGSEIHFEGDATSDNATIVNRRGSVFVSRSRRKSVHVRDLENDSKLSVGTVRLDVGKKLTLSRKSTVSMRASKKGNGKITVSKKARLGGKLTVTGATSVKAGRYALITSKNAIVGRFAKEKLKGFGSKLTASLLYQRRKVLLVVAEK